MKRELIKRKIVFAKPISDYTCDGQPHSWFYDRTKKIVRCRTCGKETFKRKEK